MTKCGIKAGAICFPDHSFCLFSLNLSMIFSQFYPIILIIVANTDISHETKLNVLVLYLLCSIVTIAQISSFEALLSHTLHIWVHTMCEDCYHYSKYFNNSTLLWTLKYIEKQYERFSNLQMRDSESTETWAAYPQILKYFYEFNYRN